MLVAAIERNQASKGDKIVARVMPSLRSASIAIRDEPSNFRRQLPGRDLRNEDRRHGDRRNRPSESTAQSFQMGDQDYIVSLSESARKYRGQPLPT